MVQTRALVSRPVNSAYPGSNQLCYFEVAVFQTQDIEFVSVVFNVVSLCVVEEPDGKDFVLSMVVNHQQVMWHVSE